MRALVIDIETAPNLAHVWSLWKQNVALNQIIIPGYVLCFAAKWLGEREVHFARVRHDPVTREPTEASRRAMLDKAHALLSQADAVIHYNGASFDIPRLNTEFMELGYKPPPPVDQVDLLLAIKKRAAFASNKLAFVAERLGVGQKVKHEGHDLWKKCMADEPAAWERMERYNKGDVRLTESVYKRILPWIPSHPNRGLFVDLSKPCCPSCGSTRLIRQGVRRTRVQTYARFSCKKCGAWSHAGERLSKQSVPRRSV